VLPTAISEQPTSPSPSSTATQHHQPQHHPHCASYCHSKRVAKRSTFLPVSRNCLRPSDPRLCYSILSLSLSLPARSSDCVLSSATHPQPATPACLLSLTAPISWPTSVPAFYNPFLRQGSTLRFWYFHTTAIRAPALRFRILPVLAKTPT
jgi:hypothetical protein